jgi:hypothetical protein
MRRFNLIRESVKTGGKGIRTPGLLIANETLYQLSYTPILVANRCKKMRSKGRLSTAFTRLQPAPPAVSALPWSTVLRH